VPDRFRPLLNFDDLDESECRLQAQFGQESSDPGRAEVLTQLARVQGLRGDFEACERLLEGAQSLAGGQPVALTRIERRPEEAAALLEQCIGNSDPDPYFHQELSEIYAALGREEAAREQAELAERLR
jgi:hypothetical protein